MEIETLEIPAEPEPKKARSSSRSRPKKKSSEKTITVGAEAANQPGVDSRERSAQNSAEREYKQFLDETLGPATLFLAMILCFTLRVPSDPLAEQLAMTDDEVALISTPASRLLAKQKYPTAIRKKIIQSGDWVGLTIGLGAYLIRISEVLKEVQRYAQPGGYPAQAARAQSNGTGPTGPEYDQFIASLGGQYYGG